MYNRLTSFSRLSPILSRPSRCCFGSSLFSTLRSEYNGKSSWNKNGKNQNTGKWYNRGIIGVSGVLGGICLALLANRPYDIESAGSELSGRDVCSLVKSGNVESLKKYLKSIDQSSVNQLRHPLGWTPLHVAITKNNVELVRALIDFGADVNVIDEFTLPVESPDNFADWVDRVTSRKREFGDSNINPLKDMHLSALHYAALVENPDIVKALMDKGADPFKVDDSGSVPKDYLSHRSPLMKTFDLYEKDFAEMTKEKERDKRRKFPLSQHLRNHVLGQEQAVDLVVSAIRRSDLGWVDESKPLVFLFLGSSGIGKTETAKRIADYLDIAAHDDKNSTESSFLRIDMSEFQSKHEVSRLIGSPPGYIGFEEGGQLTEKLLRIKKNKTNTRATVLFDEVEKAHSDVLNIFLALFDEGRLTSGKGETVSCQDAIFIMTSNLAQTEIANHVDMLRKADENDMKEFMDTTIRPILRNHFLRDEFLGRIDEMVVFLPFGETEVKDLVEKELKGWQDKAKARHEITMTFTPALVPKIMQGFDVAFGARSIKTAVNRQVINPLAKAHENDLLFTGCSVDLDVKPDGKVAFNIKGERRTSKKRTWFGLYGG